MVGMGLRYDPCVRSQLLYEYLSSFVAVRSQSGNDNVALDEAEDCGVVRARDFLGEGIDILFSIWQMLA